MAKDERSDDWKRRRTRVDPPDLSEAIVAAQGITACIEEQVEIAASLMGLSKDEVREAVLKAKPIAPMPPAGPPRLYSNRSQPAVVLEVRNRRTIPIGRHSSIKRPG